MFNNIVVAIDRSDHSRRAVDVATSLAVQYGAKLAVCHVKLTGPVPENLRRMCEIEHLVPRVQVEPAITQDVSSNLSIAKRANQGDSNDELIHQILAERLVSQAVTAARDAGVDGIVSQIAAGEPSSSILECAIRNDADLIVMGRRGLSDIKGLVMGSVSHKVAERADCACLTVK